MILLPLASRFADRTLGSNLGVCISWSDFERLSLEK